MQQEVLETLRQWVLPLGAKLREADREALDVRRKGRVDLVTELDEFVQAELLGHLRSVFPGDQIVAEEGDMHAYDPAAPVWFIDPLDGTTNFVHGFPFYCISAARWVGGRPELAMVYAPGLDELFLASRGGGAFVERVGAGMPRARLAVSGRQSLSESLLATGFPYERAGLSGLNLNICAHVLATGRGIRRAGSAALDLCYVAAGRLDGFWEFGLSPWDVAAGALIAQEAGAVVSDFEGHDNYLHGRRIVATTAAIHGEMLELLAQVHREPRSTPLGEIPAGPLSLREE